jgi:hypothetical protein
LRTLIPLLSLGLVLIGSGRGLVARSITRTFEPICQVVGVTVARQIVSQFPAVPTYPHPACSATPFPTPERSPREEPKAWLQPPWEAAILDLARSADPAGPRPVVYPPAPLDPLAHGCVLRI